jgi:hypothetical protein
VLLAVIALAGGAALFMRSGTGRTYARVVDTRLVLEAADAALAEALVQVRRSADGAGPQPGRCDDDWRALLTGAFLTGAPRPTGRVVRPLRARDVYREDAPGLAIGDVRVDLVMAYPGRAGPGGVVWPRQGVLELAVRVQGRGARLDRVVRQRRIFFATEQSVPAVRGGTVTRTTFHLPPHPLGTVIE